MGLVVFASPPLFRNVPATVFKGFCYIGETKLALRLGNLGKDEQHLGSLKIWTKRCLFNVIFLSIHVHVANGFRNTK